MKHCLNSLLFIAVIFARQGPQHNTMPQERLRSNSSIVMQCCFIFLRRSTMLFLLLGILIISIYSVAPFLHRQSSLQE
jgi:hypothetical protein